MTSGRHSVNWTGEDNSGAKVSSGVYFYELRAESSAGDKYSHMKKMILMK
jgi:flagellar hook assembly protein FlgD